MEMETKKRWAVQMSEEMQELINDYKFYQLHEHLFDGADDIWLSNLDRIFDSTVLDCELFGIEVPDHFALMSIVGGVLALPLFMIIHLVTESSSTNNLTSFMGSLDSKRVSNFDFYSEMFNSRWQNCVVVTFLMLLYTLKPVATTQAVLSMGSSTHYLAVEIISKVVFVFVTMIAVNNKAFVSSMEAIGLMLALLSQNMYLNYSDKHKEQLSVKSAADAIKCSFTYDSIEELNEFESKLQTVQENFSSLDAYRIFYDTMLSKDMRQLDYPQLSASLLH